MKKYTVIYRLLISFGCIVFLLTSCDDSAKSPQKPTVVRKKIAAKGQPKGNVIAQKPSPAKPGKKAPQPAAPEPKPVKAEKPPVAKPPPPAAAPAKPAPAPPASKPPQKPMVAQVTPAPQKSAGDEVPKPKSDISELTPAPKASAPPKQVAAKGSEDQQSKPLLASATGYSPLYNPAGKIDPFEPLYRDKPSPKKVKKSKRKPRGRLTPLEKIDISQLKLVGIIMAGSGNRALVEESSGKGYVIRKGTKIGRNFGIVTAINKNAVIVEEEYEDVFGKLKVQKKELKLPKPPGEL